MTILAGILMLGILIFVHELGHFCVAKFFGVKVLRFSLGFGPRLVSKRYGETEYMVCAIPLGGYVQMLGEGKEEEGKVAELSAEEAKRSFAGKPVGQRMAIVSAGPLMNLLFPFVVMPLAYLIGVNLPAYLEEKPCIGFVAPESPAAVAGVAAGDCILAVNEKPTPTWEASDKALVTASGRELELRIRRGEETLELRIPEDHGGIEGTQALGMLPRMEAEVGSLMPGMPAQEAGLREGDRILEIEGTPIRSWYDLREVIQQKGEAPQRFLIERDAQRLSLELTPRRGSEGEDLLVGIAPAQDSVFKRFGPVDAVRAGWNRTTELIGLTLLFIQKIFLGEVSSKSIGGPITVMQVAGQAAQADMAAIFSVLAFLSIQLGILNLLPIPILDGGHLFFYLWEVIFRRPLSTRARELAQQIGLFLLLALMALAFYNDILRLILGGGF